MAKRDWPELKGPLYVRVFRFATRFIGVVVVIAIVAAIAGFIYQLRGEINDARAYPPPGKLYDIGTHKLHAQVLGEGSPTVVFDCGLGSSSIDWNGVAPEVARTTRVVTYDRAGYGWSESGPQPRTSEQIVRELHALLETMGVEGPYILVGHSFGGVNVRVFRHHYPDEVAGMVLVESSHEEQNDRFPPQIREMGEGVSGTMRIFETLSRFGAARIVARLFGESSLMFLPRPLPQPDLEQYGRFIVTPKVLGTVADEAAGLEDSFAQGRAAGKDLGNIPLVVLTGGKSIRTMNFPDEFPIDEIERVWLELQAELAGYSKNGRQELVPESGHYLQLQYPETVVKAVAEVVTASRWTASQTEEPGEVVPDPAAEEIRE